MKSSPFRSLLTLLCAFVFSIVTFPVPFAAAETGYQIQHVAVVGNNRVDSAAIRAQLKVVPGAVKASEISEDVKAIYQTGFFDQVSAKIVDTTKGKDLHYLVVEKPVVRKVYIKGNKEATEGELAGVLRFDSRRFLDQAKASSLVMAAEKYYQAQGFYNAHVTWETLPVGDNEVDVTFNVQEGERFRVRKVKIEGTNLIDSDDILTELQTRRYKWWSSWLLGTGRLNTDYLEADKTAVRQYLLDHGFVEGSVGEAVIEKKDNGLIVTFPVREGRQFKVGGITVAGDLLPEGAEKTLEGTKTVPGETFNASVVREDSFTISDKFTDVGYAYANVVPSTNLDRENATVDIEFTITKGAEVTINRINVRGNEKTYDNVVRRELKIAEQDTYSSSKIKKSQTRLQRLGFFEEVNIASQPAERPDQVDLTVNVREGSTGSFSAGAGYSSSDGALVNAKLTEANLFGRGRSINLNVDLGTQNENLVLSYDDRHLADSNWALGVDLQRTDREFSDFDRFTQGGGFSFGYPLEEILGSTGEDMDVDIQYQLFQVEIQNVEDDAADLVKAQAGESTVSAVTPRITRNTIDNPLNPTNGSRQIVSVEFAGMGGDQEYYLAEARNQWYKRLFGTDFGDFVFSWRFRFGYGETFNNEKFPLFKRFFPGGINSVRGYDERSLGPKDSNNKEFGGSKQLVNNLEVIFPLINSAGLRGVVFYDAGQAFDDDVTLTLSDLRQAYGYGLRWTSPLGPIRIEFGFPIAREEGENSMVTLFSFGAPF